MHNHITENLNPKPICWKCNRETEVGILCDQCYDRLNERIEIDRRFSEASQGNGTLEIITVQ